MRTAFSLVPKKWVSLSICFVAAFAALVRLSEPQAPFGAFGAPQQLRHRFGAITQNGELGAGVAPS